MSGKGKGKVAGPAPVKLLDGIPVGEHRDRLISAIVTHVTHCDNFSPCISWTEHKKANRVNELWNILKENLHRYYDEAIKAGSDESTANTQIVLKVFGRKRLRIECSGPSMQRSRRFSSSSSAELEVLKEEVAAEKKKREEIEHTLGSLLNILRQNGLMLLDESTDHHIETSVQHTESNEEQMD